jgi:hypothetical protein
MEFSSPAYTPSKNSRLSLSRVKKLRRESQGKENNFNESVQSSIDDDKKKHNKFTVTSVPMESPNDIHSQHSKEDKKEEEESHEKIQFHVEINGDALHSSSSSSSECEGDSLDDSVHNMPNPDYEDLEFTACHPSDDENDFNDDLQLQEEDRKPAHEKEMIHKDSDDDLFVKPSPLAKSRAMKQQNVFLLDDDSDNNSIQISRDASETSKAVTSNVHYGLRSPPPYPRNILSKPKYTPTKSSLLRDCIESSSDEDSELSILKGSKTMTPSSSGIGRNKESNEREIIFLDDDSEDDKTLSPANDGGAKRSAHQSLMPQHWGSSGIKKRRPESSSVSAALSTRPISLSDINYSRNDLTGGSGLGLGGVQVLKGAAQSTTNDSEDEESSKKSKRAKLKRSKTTGKSSTKTKSKRKRSKSSVKRRRTGGTKASKRTNAFRANRSSNWDATQDGIRPYNGGDNNTNGSYGWSRGRQRGTRLGEVNLDPRLGNLGGATIQF